MTTAPAASTAGTAVPRTMHAVTQDAYGPPDALTVGEVPVPTTRRGPGARRRGPPPG